MGINDLLVKIDGKLSDATNPTNDRTALANDIKALANEINSTLKNTKFNDTNILYSAAGSGFTRPLLLLTEAAKPGRHIYGLAFLSFSFGHSQLFLQAGFTHSGRIFNIARRFLYDLHAQFAHAKPDLFRGFRHQ